MSEEKVPYAVSTYEPDDQRDHILLRLFERPIAFHRAFLDLTGNVTSALMLSQAFYWSKRTKDPSGWFYKSSDEWQEETGLNRKQQQRVRKKLKEFEWWQEDLRKANGAPTLHYRINLNLLSNDLIRMGQNDPIEWDKTTQSKEWDKTTQSNNIEYQENTTEKDPLERKPRQRTEHREIVEYAMEAERIGLTPQQFRILVDSILEACSLLVLINNSENNKVAMRKHNDAREAAIFLAKLGYDAHDVVDLADKWKERNKWRDNPIPNPMDLQLFASNVSSEIKKEYERQNVRYVAIGGDIE